MSREQQGARRRRDRRQLRLERVDQVVEDRDRLANCGVPPVVLKNFMGHASAAFSIDVYGHVSAGDLNDAAALLSAYRERSLGTSTTVTSIAARDARGIAAGSGTGAAAS